eukprot:gene4326-biopygen6903
MTLVVTLPVRSIVESGGSLPGRTRAHSAGRCARAVRHVRRARGRGTASRWRHAAPKPSSACADTEGEPPSCAIRTVATRPPRLREATRAECVPHISRTRACSCHIPHKDSRHNQRRKRLPPFPCRPLHCRTFRTAARACRESPRYADVGFHTGAETGSRESKAPDQDSDGTSQAGNGAQPRRQLHTYRTAK